MHLNKQWSCEKEGQAKDKTRQKNLTKKKASDWSNVLLANRITLNNE